MSTLHQPVNPLFKPLAPPRTAAQRAVKFGGYGGMAVAAWLFTAVATGYGCAAADTTGASDSSSSSSSTSSGSMSSPEPVASAESGSTASAGGETGSSGSSTGAASSAESTGATTSGATSPGSTSSSTEVAPGVTVSSSGGAHTSSAGESATAGGEEVTEPTATSQSTETTGNPTPTVVVEQSKSTHAEAVTAASTPSATSAAPLADVTPSSDSAESATPKAPEVSTASVARVAAVATIESASPTSQVLAAAVAPAQPAPQVAGPVVGVVGFLSNVVATLLNPFLAPAPSTPDPFTPVVWAVLGFVRRQLFNQAPVVSSNPTTVQTGQTVTGNIGAVDPEGDALTYTVTRGPEHGTLTIDQATGNFTYTPDDIDYTEVQQDSFSVSVSDGKTNLLSLLGVSHTTTSDIDVDVLNPQVERVIVNMPDGITKPVNPRYAEGGQSILFAGTPAAGGRQEIYQIDIDGTDAKCLTCGLAAPAVAGTNPALPINIQKPVPFYDGTGRIVVLLNNPEPRYAIFEPEGYNGVGSPARIVDVVTPDGGGATLPGLPPSGILNRQREMRPSPDGTHVLFTRIVFGQTGNFQAIPIVGALTANGDHYEVTDARVVWPTGESKQWTPDGKGVIIQGGAIEAGNVDDILVDLSGQTGDILYPGTTWRGTRITGNLDYDEDIDMSPNKQWITVGSTRGLDALTPMTRIVRQNFLPFYVGAAIYDQYADGQVRNISNQNWAVAVEDDLKRENGIPLFVQDDPNTPGIDEGDGWISRSMPSWNPDGTAVTFWESGNGDEHGIAPTQSRLVIANLKYTTSVGPVGDTTTVVDLATFPALSTYVAKTTPLPPTGTYNGVGGGTAVVSDVVDAATRQTTRTVVYTNYVNEDGLILNGTESSSYGPSQLSVTYLADIDVTDSTGAARGSLDADAKYTLLPTQAVTGYITSTLDGDTQTIPDPAKVEDAKTGA